MDVFYIINQTEVEAEEVARRIIQPATWETAFADMIERLTSEELEELLED